MKQNLCNEPTCPFYGRYCRQHKEDTEPEQKDRMKEYMRLRKEFLAANPKCGFDGCKKDAKDVHHQAGRTGDLLLDTRFFFPLCRGHHLYIESHPVFAKEHGYSVSRLGGKVRRHINPTATIEKKETVKT